MISKSAFAAMTGSEAESLSAEEPRNGLIHAAALTLTKTADGLISTRLALAWLLASIGAPPAAIGALVPLREAGSLLPQLWLAPIVSRAPQAKRLWALGSVLQGLAAIGVALVAFSFEGALAGWTIVALVAALAVARSLCSLSYKDALARTIGKTRRGAVSGLPASIAAAVVLAYAAGLSIGVPPLSVLTLSIAIAVAGALWFCGAALFLNLDEERREGTPDESGERLRIFETLRAHPQLRRFILARALLTVTALAPPYLLLVSGQASGENGGGPGALGVFMVASSLASILSGYVWGRLSDRSSRLVMAIAAALSACVFLAAALMSGRFGDFGGALGGAAVIFVAQLAYEGVRAARKLHVVDMAGDADRARFVAISNTAIGAVLALGGLFGVLAEFIGAGGVLWLFAAFSALAIPAALSLDEVQAGDS